MWRRIFRAVLAGSFLTCIFSSHSLAQTNTTRLPETVVTDRPTDEARPGWLQEEQPIGPNNQPEWTTRRRFATTRVYVSPPGQWEFEQWWKGKFPREGKAEQFFQSEVSVGLPHRLQLDLYENVEIPQGGELRHQGIQIEGRWALADWGKIPGNPTIYGEWKFNSHEPDAYELKLLFGDEFASRWHWGANAFFEQQVGGGRESELGASFALSYSVVDEKLAVGVEMNLERSSEPNFDGNPATEFLIGPSVQWRPTPRTHVDLVPLVGATHDSPLVEAFIVFGFDFGRGGDHQGPYAPTSMRSH